MASSELKSRPNAPCAEAASPPMGSTEQPVDSSLNPYAAPLEPLGGDAEGSISVESTGASAAHSRRRLLRGGMWVMFGRALGVGSIVLMNMLLARRLALTDFALYNIAKSLAAPISIAAMLGWNSALLRFIAERLGLKDPAGARHYLKLSCASVAVVSTALLLLTAGPPGQMLGERLQLPDAAGIMPLIGVWLFLSAWHQFLAEGLRGCHEQRFATLIAGEMGGPLANSLFCVVLLFYTVFPADLNLRDCLRLSVAIQALLLPVTMWLLFSTLRRRTLEIGTPEPRPVPGWRDVLGKVCVPLMFVSLIASLIGQGDVWLAGRFCSLDDVAMYAAARRLMLLVMTPLMLANAAILPTVAELFPQRKLRELQRVLQQTATLAGIPAAAACVLLVVFPGPILTLVFGADFRPAAPLAAILGASQLIYVGAGVWPSALNMAGRHGETLWINIVTALGLLILCPVAAIYGGVLGLALATATVVSFQNILGWWRAWAVLGVRTNASPRCLFQWYRQATQPAQEVPPPRPVTCGDPE